MDDPTCDDQDYWLQRGWEIGERMFRGLTAEEILAYWFGAAEMAQGEVT